MEINVLQKGIDFLKSQGVDFINLYCFGSHIYGTADEDSDFDYIAVVKTMPLSGKYLINKVDKIDFHFYTPEEFQLELHSHNLQLLECFFNPSYSKIEAIQFSFSLDKNLLRQAVSSLMQNSWVKGRKKLTIKPDFDLRVALKSLFHSFKTCSYGIQIANQGKIVVYDEYNWFLEDLWKMATIADSFTNEDNGYLLWAKIKEKHEGNYNKIRSKFQTLCPKINLDIKRQTIKKLFKTHNTSINMDLINDIIKELS